MLLMALVLHHYYINTDLEGLASWLQPIDALNPQACEFQELAIVVVWVTADTKSLQLI